MIKSFFDQVLAGEIDPSAINDAIDAWHSGHPSVPLHEYLGMTWEEYAAFVAEPSALARIVATRITANKPNKSSSASVHRTFCCPVHGCKYGGRDPCAAQAEPTLRPPLRWCQEPDLVPDPKTCWPLATVVRPPY